LTYYGYVTSRIFGDICMPVPAQNSCIREYVKNKKGDYVLPALESHFDNCYHQLFNLANTAPNECSIIMYSLSMMPSNEKLGLLISKCKERSLSLVFVLEALEIKSNYEDLIHEMNDSKVHKHISDYEEIKHFL